MELRCVGRKSASLLLLYVSLTCISMPHDNEPYSLLNMKLAPKACHLPTPLVCYDLTSSEPDLEVRQEKGTH